VEILLDHFALVTAGDQEFRKTRGWRRSSMRCHRRGFPPISTIGLDVPWSPRESSPLPPARMTTFISVHHRFRHRSDKPPAQSPITCLLMHNFIRKIPGQNENVVRPEFLQCRDRSHWNMHSRCIEPHFAIASVHSKGNHVRIDAAVVSEEYSLSPARHMPRASFLGPTITHQVAEQEPGSSRRRRRTSGSAPPNADLLPARRPQDSTLAAAECFDPKPA